MKSHKFKLLAATIIAGAAFPAQAQMSFPSAELRGAGASAVSDINVKVQNCIGVNNDQGNTNGTTTNIVEADFAPTSPTTANPTLTCSVDDVNGNIYNGTGVYDGKYVSTGSGFGREMWRLFSDRFPAAGLTNPFGTWTKLQMAFSEAPATTSDITAYNTNAAPTAGKAIQLPFYVVPIAFAYNPVYGTKAGADLAFRVKVPAKINNIVAGGLRLNKAAYCDIWNGVITNWNHQTLKTLNGNQDLRALADDATRWSTEGVPIRLIGRADRSGTTDLFTRALAAQCAGASNKFQKAAESLPFDSSGTINITLLRSDSRYAPGVAASNFAGTIQSLNGYVSDANNRFCFWNELVSRLCPVAPAAIPAGAQVGSFTVADGSTRVAVAIETLANNTALASSDPTVLLNGKFGYVGGDFVSPTPGRNLHSAALQQGTSATAYVMPSALNASKAFGTVPPPQTTLASGKYDITDARTVYKDLTNTALGTEAVSRANPLHWVNILYPPTGATLANPTLGYPITGASNLLTYTCFDSVAKRLAMANFIGYVTGKVTKKNAIGGTPASISLSANTFKGPGATVLGILSKANIAVPAAGWLTAYQDTFLKKSTTDGDPSAGIAKLGDLNLWIQSKQPTTALQIDGSGVDDPLPNPGCTANVGA